MTKEIKEILDYLKDDSKSFIICGSSYYKISDYKAKILLDYITNLQNLCDKYEEEHKTTFEEWKKDIKANKKAIEYIGQHFIEEGSCEINKITGEYTCEGNENFLEELLNILQGSDKE